jgi:hypothetical protein
MGACTIRYGYVDIQIFLNLEYDTAKIRQQKFYTKTYIYVKYLKKINID